MIPLTKWLERTFPERPPVNQFPAIVDRLRGTPVRVQAKLDGVPREVLIRRQGDRWSPQEHVGHLLDLETLWNARIDELLSASPELCAADMSNRATYEANHNASSAHAIASTFRESRDLMVAKLDQLTEQQVAATALHPRLKQPMRMIDLCHFVAEHDDHHLAIIERLLRSAA